MSWIWYVCQGQQQKCAVGGTRGVELSTAYSSGSQVIYDWVPFCATIDFVTPVKPICVAGWLFFLSLSAKCCQLPSIFSHYCSFLTCVCVCPLYVSWTPCRRFRDLAGERHQRLFDFPHPFLWCCGVFLPSSFGGNGVSGFGQGSINASAGTHRPVSVPLSWPLWLDVWVLLLGADGVWGGGEVTLGVHCSVFRQDDLNGRHCWQPWWLVTWPCWCYR